MSSSTVSAQTSGSIGGATIVNIEWRVDIAISSMHDVEHVAIPIAVVGLRLSNNMVLTYRLKPEELHQWRFSMAKGMRDMLYLQQKQPHNTAKKHHRQ